MTKLIKIEKTFFYLLVFFLPFQIRLVLRQFSGKFNEWSSAYLYLTDIMILALLVFWGMRIFSNARLLKKIKPQESLYVSFCDFARKAVKRDFFILAFLVVGALSLLVADNAKLGFYSWLKLLEFSFFFFYLKYNFSRFLDLEKVFQVLVGAAIFQSVFAIAQFFRQKSLGIKYLESPISPEMPGVAKIILDGKNIIRAYGLMPHPNILVAFLFLAIFGLAFLFFKNCGRIKTGGKIIFGLIATIFLWAFVLTFSRVAAAIGLLFFLSWLVWNGRKKEFKKLILSVLSFFAVVLALLILVYYSSLFARYSIENFGKSQAVDLRVYYNKAAWDSIKEIPVSGVGQGNFVWDMSRLGLLPDWMYQPAHNIYLLIGSEIGVLGVLFFVFFLFLIWFGFVKAKVSFPENCLIFFFYFIIITGLFDHYWWDIQQGQLMLWLVLGILASFGYEVRRVTGLSLLASPPTKADND